MSLDQTKAETIRAWFRENPARMTIKASRYFEVTEAEVLEALKPEWPLKELRPDAFEEILEGLREIGKVRILVRNGLAVLESDHDLCNAHFTKSSGVFFNIGGEGLDMHIRYKEFDRIFALEKKSHMNPDNITYSFQFYGNDGNVAMKIFLWEDFPQVPTRAIEIFHRIVKKIEAARDVAQIA